MKTWLGWVALATMVGCGPIVDAEDTDGSTGASASTEAPQTNTTRPVTTEPGTSIDPSTTTAPPPPQTTTTFDDTGYMPPVLDLPQPGGEHGGTYLLVVQSNLSPDFPFQYLLEVDDPGDGTVDLELTQLSLYVGATMDPRKLVGFTLLTTGIPLHGDDMMDLELLEYMQVGDANPVTGSDLLLSAVLIGQWVEPDVWCGTVEGELHAPIMQSLAGSTFIAIPVEIGDELPPPPIPAVCP